MIDAIRIEEEFVRRYGRAPRMFRAPGRINLIGEHTDYNNGFCMPFGIDRETVVAAAPRDDRTVRVFSVNMDEEITFDLGGDEPARRRGHWIDYVEGMARVLGRKGARLSGTDMVLGGDIPEGAGLSSSASLEISVGIALLALASEENVDSMSLARAGQETEHVYAGTMSGLMDQLAVSFAREGHALLIDCESYTLETIPLDLGDHRLVAIDTRVKHQLASSEYNDRRRECEEAVSRLTGEIDGLRSLRHVTADDLDRLGHLLPDPLLRRARHVVSENRRTLEAADALRRGQLSELGRLMTESHRSLRHDYEVSCAELDLLVDVALECDGVAGARMTGGGFGGCTITLAREDALDAFLGRAVAAFRSAFGRDPAVIPAVSSDGAGELA